MRRDPGSFRDPAGHVFLDGGRIYRVITEAGKSEYERVRDSGLLAELAEKGWVVDSHETEHRGGLPERAAYVVEHPKLPFISYPYEWSFYGLRDAALLQLDIHLASLERGITLNDASAYNVQFIGSDPIFIDTLSFREYRQDEPWIGHRQFCEHYLNPLLLRSVLGIPHNAWFRGDMDGIRVEHLARLLPLKSRFSLSLLQHVFLQAYFQRRAARARPTAAPPKPVRLPASMYKKLLLDMRTIVSRLHPAQGETVWAGYAESHSYQTDEVRAKAQFIADFCRAVSPKILWDVGCNTGDYSVVALSNGAERVIGFDFDVGALDRAYRRARAESLNFLPLHLDAMNPSPSQGWGQRERGGLMERANADGLLALALVHHLAIAKNVPLDDVVQWLLGLSSTGVIEFVPKEDSMVGVLLSNREDIFASYDKATFEQHLMRHARIVRQETVSRSGRVLYWYQSLA